MTATVERIKIEVLVDAPLVRRVTEAADRIGVTGYTLLRAIGGLGRGGRWSDDQLTGAQAKVLFMTVTGHEQAAALTEALRPLLDSHGLLLTRTAVEVVRGERY